MSRRVVETGTAKGRSEKIISAWGVGAVPLWAALLTAGVALAPLEGAAQVRRGMEGGDRQARALGGDARALAGQARSLAGQVMGRLRLGVALEEAVDASGRIVGVRVRDVMEESPAMAAGLQAGDLIVVVDGQSLVEGSPGPGDALERLTSRTRALSPGDEVRLQLAQDGGTREVVVVAGDLPGWGPVGPISMEGFTFRRPEGPGWPGERHFRVFRAPGGERDTRVELFTLPGMGGPTVGLGLTLQDLNPELGAYFGVEEGVVVLRVAERSTLPIRAGDVLIRVGDREVQDARHARQILSSFRSGERVMIQLRRQQRLETLEITFP